MPTIRAFNTEPYSSASNTKGITLVTPSAMDTSPIGTYAASTAPTGGAANVNPATDLTFRIRLTEDPSNSNQAYAPAVQYMRYTSSANTGSNDGTTKVTNAARGCDTQYFSLHKYSISGNDLLAPTAGIICAVTDVTDTSDFTVGQYPPYIDLKFDPLPNNGTDGELDRDSGTTSGVKYRFALKPALPAVTVGVWQSTYGSVLDATIASQADEVSAE